MNLKPFCLAFLFLSFSNFTNAARFFNLFSPDLSLQFNIQVTPEGSVRYSLYADKQTLVKEGRMGLKLKDQLSFDQGFELKQIDTSTIDSIWETVWGEERIIRDHCKRMLVHLEHTKSGRKWIVECKLYNDGVGFRYIFPVQQGLSHFIVEDELTTFPMSSNHSAFWIPGDPDTNEYLYSLTTLKEINSLAEGPGDGIGFKNPLSDTMVQTPFTMRLNNNYYMSIHEAALVNYPAMMLGVQKSKFILKAESVADLFGHKAYLNAGDRTPWRVILVGRKAADLLRNRIILNLNEPSVIKDASWIQPGKYLGIWWEMHLGTKDWAYREVLDSTLHADHGASTERVLRYIDFASQHKFPYVLVEGWNRGWEFGDQGWNERKFSFTIPYPDFDIERIHKYANGKNIKLIMHHETYGAVTDYERQMDDAYSLMKRFDYPIVKTGYVGRLVPRGESHDGQWMVNHYVHVAQKAAGQKLMLNAHEPVRPTGLHRTFPNWLSCEAGRGNEFNAWSQGNPPEHETILPFTRLLGGPMDYTPGIFQLDLDQYGSLRSKNKKVKTTLAKQLALYVTMYSPLQMAADLPENYEKHPEAFQFIKDVPTTWDTTVVIDAIPADFIYIARKERGKDHWFVGLITDENAREYKLSFDFLEPGKKYLAKIYGDGAKAHWQSNPTDYKIEMQNVSSKDQIKIKLAPGGGCAISLMAE